MAGEVLEATPDWGGLYHPSFPDHWTRCSLHSLARWVNGIAFKDIQFTTTGKPVIKIVEIKGGISGQTKFTQQNFDEAVCVRPGDLLFAWSGQPETSIDAYWWRGPEGWLNQHVFRVSPLDEIASVFFYYLLRYLKPNFVGIARNKQTTGLGHVTKRDMENLEVAYPSLTEQHAIANILGTLDDKIELNRRMNETLEAMARALFKDWFVDFGPTRTKIEGRDPYLAPEIWDLFPDKLDEDGKPEGWETQSVIDQAEWVNGAAYGNMHFSNAHDALPVVKIAELKAGVTKNTKRTNTELGDKYRIRDRELLFSWSGNPDTSIDTFIWTGGEAWLNQHIFAVRDNGARTPAFLYTMLKWLKPEFAEIARNKQTTGLGHVTKQDLKRMQIYVGPRELLEESEHLIGPLHARMQTNLVENMTLAQARDLLLPNLVSGGIRVGDTDKIVKELT